MFGAWDQMLDTTEEDSRLFMELANNLLDNVSLELQAHTARKKLLFKKVCTSSIFMIYMYMCISVLVSNHRFSPYYPPEILLTSPSLSLPLPISHPICLIYLSPLHLFQFILLSVYL